MKLAIALAGLFLFSTGVDADSKNIIRTYAPIKGDSTVQQPAAPSSCLDIKNSEPTSGSGVYSITISGQQVAAYCDMQAEGGGWTLVGRGAPLAPGNWGYTSEDLALSESPSPATAYSWKFSDTKINAISKTAFKVISTGYNNTRFWKGSCDYHQLQSPTGDCSISYSGLDWSGSRGNGLSGDGGLADHRASVPNDGYFISTSSAGKSYGWSAGNGTTSTYLGTAVAGTIIGIAIWVR